MEFSSRSDISDDMTRILGQLTQWTKPVKDLEKRI